MLWVADRDLRRPHSGDVWGCPQHLLLMIGAYRTGARRIGADADARSFLLQELPALVELPNERSLPTDDLESRFAALVASAGYKATPMAALGKLRAVDRIAALKISPGLGIHLRSFRQSHYTHHQRAAVAAGGKS